MVGGKILTKTGSYESYVYTYLNSYPPALTNHLCKIITAQLGLLEVGLGL